MFKHNLIKFDDLETTEKDGKRYYIVEDKSYLSVTSLLSFVSEKSINKWKKKIGEEAAAKVIEEATSRGKSLHDLCEKYLLNEDFSNIKLMPHDRMRFNDIKSVLDEHVDNIRGIEFPLYSDMLKLAGR